MYIQQTRQWIQSIVIDLNLCPFAKREMDNNTVKIEVGSATTFKDGISEFMREIKYLNTNPTIGTTLLLFPHFLNDFFDYLDFVDLATEAMAHAGYQDIYQLATFHPAYRFHGTNDNDVTNYTNRSPYPMLHILREDMLDGAIAYYGDTETIPENNMRLMQSLGLVEIRKKLADCMKIK
jgi:hypothetical protein